MKFSVIFLTFEKCKLKLKNWVKTAGAFKDYLTCDHDMEKYVETSYYCYKGIAWYN